MRAPTVAVTITAMDDQAFAALPRAYRVGLRLRTLGADNALIADCLDIDADAVVTLLEIGARKLEHVEQTTRKTTTPPTPATTDTSPGSSTGLRA